MRIILISLAVAVFIIGLHQTFTVGASASYFIFMISLALIFAARIVKGKEIHPDKKPASAPRAKSGIGKPKVKKGV